MERVNGLSGKRYASGQPLAIYAGGVQGFDVSGLVYSPYLNRSAPFQSFGRHSVTVGQSLGNLTSCQEFVLRFGLVLQSFPDMGSVNILHITGGFDELAAYSRSPAVFVDREGRLEVYMGRFSEWGSSASSYIYKK